MEQSDPDIKIIARAASELKIPVFRDRLDEFAAMASEKGWTTRQLMARIMEAQLLQRAQNRCKALLRRAEFPQLKYLAEIEAPELPADARTALPSLATLDFIRQGRNLVLYGNPGTGKTHLATALGIEACAKGMSVLFASVPHLITKVREARQERTLRLLENRFAAYDLVICDEFGYVSCDKAAGELLFNHLSLRAAKKSTIITTNLSFDRWGEIIPDPVLVSAMIDRLTHKAILINMTGQSYRIKETKRWIQHQKSNKNN